MVEAESYREFPAMLKTVAIAAFCLAVSGAVAQTVSPPGAAVYMIAPANGAVVTNPFKVQFGLAGMGVAPAGVEKENTGHHHLLIDTTLSPDELKEPIALNETHKHYGAGQTEAMVTLPPGRHTLQLVMGDWSHVPHAPPVQSAVVTIEVK